MIPFDLIYCRPESLEEAVEAYSTYHSEGLSPEYLAGGTEIVTLARDRRITPGAVIDIKSIPECRRIEMCEDGITMGAACPLNELASREEFPLLAAVASRVADHTVRNRLSLGGNIAGRLPYRETVLPLLLADARALLAGPAGRRSLPLAELFDKGLRLEPGELLVQLEVGRAVLRAPWCHRRRERGTRIDYPLLSLALTELDGVLRMAVSGLCDFPFRERRLEALINDRQASARERAEAVAAALPHRVRSDQRASSDYRLHLFKQALAQSIEELEVR